MQRRQQIEPARDVLGRLAGNGDQLFELGGRHINAPKTLRVQLRQLLPRIGVRGILFELLDIFGGQRVGIGRRGRGQSAPFQPDLAQARLHLEFGVLTKLAGFVNAAQAGDALLGGMGKLRVWKQAHDPLQRDSGRLSVASDLQLPIRHRVQGGSGGLLRQVWQRQQFLNRRGGGRQIAHVLRLDGGHQHVAGDVARELFQLLARLGDGLGELALAPMAFGHEVKGLQLGYVVPAGPGVRNWLYHEPADAGSQKESDGQGRNQNEQGQPRPANARRDHPPDEQNHRGDYDPEENLSCRVLAP